jgi:hypothetical protein
MEYLLIHSSIGPIERISFFKQLLLDILRAISLNLRAFALLEDSRIFYFIWHSLWVTGVQGKSKSSWSNLAHTRGLILCQYNVFFYNWTCQYNVLFLYITKGACNQNKISWGKKRKKSKSKLQADKRGRWANTWQNNKKAVTWWSTNIVICHVSWTLVHFGDWRWRITIARRKVGQSRCGGRL